MQKRAEELKGKMTIQSEQRKGTIITVNLAAPSKIPDLWGKKKNI